jgi:nitrite reductase/ring-hydroxylating ferredoxin subunit
MADHPRVICKSEDLRDGATGVRFALRVVPGRVAGPAEFEQKGFVVRYRGKACAFVNRCPHLGTELDWQPGEFFEESGLYLVCSTHGALFEPDTGFCVAGPCRGASLDVVQVRELDGQVLLVGDTPRNSARANAQQPK